MSLITLNRQNPSKKLLLLIDPYPEDNPYRLKEKEMRQLWFPKLSLPVIAARTPGHWAIEIIDESRTIVRPALIEKYIRERGPENILVGLSTQMTCYTPRAYEIADQFRARGVKVCIGGTHATYLTEEAARHADTIVRFEADDIWPDVIGDFERGNLQAVYEMGSYPAMEPYPWPRVDLLPHEAYMTNQCLQTTRGCHFDCDFCSVSPFNGKSSRRRTVEDIVAEIQRLKEWRRNQLVEKMVRGPLLRRIGNTLLVFSGIEDGTIFAFVDDLHNSNRDYCKKLWTALKELNISWGAQCTLFLANDRELVKLAADSGCVSMFVGLESINQDVLKQMNKNFNQEMRYEDQIKTFHDHGIMVNPGVIFGSDADDESVFESTVEFLNKCQVELSYMNIATPLPGTVLFDRLKAEKRIFDWNWSHYDGKHVVFQPKQMTPKVLQDGFFWANREIFSLSSIARRMSYTSQRFIPRLLMNLQFRKLVLRTCPRGRLSPLNQVIKGLQGQFPSVDTGNLIPNTLWAVKNSVRTATGQIDRYLRVKVRRAERLVGGLVIELEGTLDRFNVGKVKKRVLRAAKKARTDIVINFEHLRYAAPEAIRALLEWEPLRRITPSVKIKVMNLNVSFKETLGNFSLTGLEVSKEEIG